MIIKKWLIVEKIDENGNVSMQRTNKGFSVIELIGICEFVKLELMERVKNDATPDIIKLKVHKKDSL